MNLKTIYIFSLLFLLGNSFIYAQNPPKRELRATWIASVDRIDWPKSRDATTQKKELISILDKLEEANMNSIFFQIRPMADALYKSKYEPWSHYLSGVRGKDPGYDPLAFAIEEAHKRGIEVHGWMNPYRYETGSLNHGSSDFIRKNHPEWLLYYSDRRILDPGNPEVRKHITNLVEDIISNYNIDGIIFDDYYYPYSGTTDQDSASQRIYKSPFENVGDWRRENVNTLLADIYSKIQEIKPTVKFSQGPFGIWGGSQAIANKYGIPWLNTSGGTDAYSQIYCDAVKWMKDKTVDFISPQCYWPSSNTNTWKYTTLVPWWSEVANITGRHFYSSMRMGTMGTKTSLADPIEMNTLPSAGLSNLEQTILDGFGVNLRSTAKTEGDLEIDLNRSANKQAAPGHVFFNTTQFFEYNFHTHLGNGRFSQVAIPPTLTWKDKSLHSPISNIQINNNILSWECDSRETDRFAIYLIPNNLIDIKENIESSTYLKKTTWLKQLDITNLSNELINKTFAITLYDAYGYESDVFLGTNPNSIEELTHPQELSIISQQNMIIIETNTPQPIKVSNISGQIIKETYIHTRLEIEVPPGIYIVNKHKVAIY